jgi:hypothetical protein
MGGVMTIAALVGFITLFGIAVRNGLLLMSRYQNLAAEGLPLERVIEHGSMERLAPILMTALTAALALIPLALGLGEPGTEIQAPMAWVILGGLLAAPVPWRSLEHPGAGRIAEAAAAVGGEVPFPELVAVALDQALAAVHDSRCSAPRDRRTLPV